MGNYKEKYEQALNRAKVINPGTADYEVAVKIFPELKESESERMKKAIMHILYENYTDAAVIEGVEIAEIVAWLEKQDTKESKKISIWKHWKDGIAGNGEGKLIYLIKNGNKYSLSSVLGHECDYILLSDLDKLMLQERQGGQKPVWSEEDERMVNSILSSLEYFDYWDEKLKKKVRPKGVIKEVDWLKSLKERMKEK